MALFSQIIAKGNKLRTIHKLA